MRAAVMGTHWGLVHVAALRAAGVDVIAVVGRDPIATARVAADHDIRHAISGTGTHQTLQSLDLDLISVATPQGTHVSVIRELPSQVPVICEKPAIGFGSPSDLSALRSAPVWVNYAYPFLPTAQRAAQSLARIGNIRGARTLSRCGRGRNIAPRSWFFEVAGHPVSWLLSALGMPPVSAGEDGPIKQPTDFTSGTNPLSSERPAECLSARIDVGLVPVGITVEVGDHAGVSHEIQVIGEHGEMRLTGRYLPGEPWVFDPPLLILPGTEERLVPADQGLPDPWYLANEAAIGQVVSHLRDGGMAPGFTWARAQALDLALTSTLGSC